MGSGIPSLRCLLHIFQQMHGQLFGDFLRAPPLQVQAKLSAAKIFRPAAIHDSKTFPGYRALRGE
jgi:hypothetical protein